MSERTTDAADALGTTEPAPRRQRLAAAEAVAVYLLIVLYIWWGQTHARSSVVLPLAMVAASHVWRGETPAVLGFRLTNFWRCLRRIGPWLLALTLAAIALDAAFGTAGRLTPGRALRVAALYAPWGLFQQYALNGYFVRRFAAAVRTPHRAAFLAAACFAGAHAPNWFLMGVTLAAGYLSARAYLVYRNLLVLGLAHALVGALLVLAVPRSITHGLRIGPREWRAQRAAAAPLAPGPELARRPTASPGLP